MNKREVKIQESFFPGDKWICYEIYCGIQNANKFLGDYFLPVAFELQDSRIISKWFFLRYSNPDFHLRLRFETRSKINFHKVISAMNNCFMKEYCKEVIWEVQLNTYHRELERYGKITIELAEEIFWLDSQIIISILNQPHYKSDSFGWKTAIFMMLKYLEGFYNNVNDKLLFVEKVKGKYQSEFKPNKLTKIQMSKNYRMYSREIDSVIDNFHQSIPNHNCINLLSLKLREYNKKYFDEDSKHQILSSLIHMSLNRLFINRNREQEYLCYDFLHRILKSRDAKSIDI